MSGEGRPRNLAPSAGDNPEWTHKAEYYRKLGKQRVRCLLCPRECEVGPAERGFCGVRENREGEYYTVVYGRAASVNVDPIEKKPLFHVKPGSPVFSFATAGCNLACKNCQNWQLSQSRPEQVPAVDLPPAKLVEAARDQGCTLIAGTYSEPIVFAEYMLAVAREGNKRGVRSTMISAGYISRQPLVDLCRELAAVKIDLKSMRDGFYRDNCAGTLKPVLDSIELIRKQKVWLEIVYLVVPTLNDSEREIRDLARWVKGHVGTDVPLHFSRFYPQYRLKNLPPTPYETLSRCYQIARAEGLHYVYVGNVPGSPAESTYCPKCGKRLVHREGFRVSEIRIKRGRCQYCQQIIPGLWS
jgi:pyruvate formate lyase activating enzyme